MSSPVAIAASLDESLSHAVSFLTNPLRGHVLALQLNVLAEALRRNLAQRFSKHWNPAFPKAGSGTRCLSFSPLCDPPKPVLQACQLAKIQWATWIQVLGGHDFDLVVDPNTVFARIGMGYEKQTFVIWAAVAPKSTPTTRDLVSEDDDSDLFRLIDTALQQPVSPCVATNVPWKPAARSQSTSPTSAHSRSSSSSGFSSATDSTCPTSIASASDILPSVTTKLAQFAKFTPPPSSVPLLSTPTPKLRRPKHAHVHVDSTKKAVTNYDGGKTGVLTGGTMLGAIKTSRQ